MARHFCCAEDGGLQSVAVNSRDVTSPGGEQVKTVDVHVRLHDEVIMGCWISTQSEECYVHLTSSVLGSMTQAS